MKAHFTLSLAIVATIFLIASAGCSKNSTTTTPANASWVGNYYGSVSVDINSGGSTNITDTMRITASATIPNQITLFDAIDSIPYTGTVNGTNVSMTVTFPASGGYSAQTISGTGTLTGGVFIGTAYSSYSYSGVQYQDTVYYNNMIKH